MPAAPSEIFFDSDDKKHRFVFKTHFQKLIFSHWGEEFLVNTKVFLKKKSGPRGEIYHTVRFPDHNAKKITVQVDRQLELLTGVENISQKQGNCSKLNDMQIRCAFSFSKKVNQVQASKVPSKFKLKYFWQRLPWNISDVLGKRQLKNKFVFILVFSLMINSMRLLSWTMLHVLCGRTCDYSV